MVLSFLANTGLSMASDKTLYVSRVHLTDMYCTSCNVKKLKFDTDRQFRLRAKIQLQCTAQGEPNNYYSAGIRYTLMGDRSQDFFYQASVSVSTKVSLTYDMSSRQMSHFEIDSLDFYVANVNCYNNAGLAADTFIGPFVNSLLPELQNKFNSAMNKMVVQPIIDHLENRSNWRELSKYMDKAVRSKLPGPLQGAAKKTLSWANKIPGGKFVTNAAIGAGSFVGSQVGEFDEVTSEFVRQMLTIIPTRFKFSSVTVRID